jgi:Asp/Glu/hydantoin racemase
MTRIALIHATPLAVAPIRDAFGRGWPEAETFNLLDDALSPDLERSGTVDESFYRRFAALTAYAVEGAHADAVLFTCSAFGPAIDAAAKRFPLPILKPNEAMFEAAIATGSTIGMLATLRQSIEPMEAEFRELATRHASDASIESVWVEGAMGALRAGEDDLHDELLAQAAPRLAHCDVIMLAHFSTARAKEPVSVNVNRPILTSPDSAVAQLRRTIGRQAI